MAMRLIPVSIVATIVGVTWLSFILSMEQNAHAEDIAAPTDYETAKEAASAENSAEKAAPSDPRSEPAAKPVAAPRATGNITLISPNHIEWQFSGTGGGLSSAKLLNSQFDRKETLEDADGVGIPERKRELGPMDIVPTWDEEFFPFTESFEVMEWIDNQGKKEDVVAGDTLGKSRTRPYGIVSQGEQSVTMVWPDPGQYPNSDVYIEKNIALDDNYTANISFTIYNFGDRNLDYKLSHDIFGWQSRVEGSMLGVRPNLTAGTCLVSGETFYEDFSELLDEESQGIFSSGDVSWVGVSTQYFLLAAIPTSFPAASCALQSIPVGGQAANQYGLLQVGLRQNQTKTLHAEPVPSCTPNWLPAGHKVLNKDSTSCQELYKVMPVEQGESLTRAKKRALIQAKGDTSKIAGITSAHERLSNPTHHTYSWKLFAGPKDIDEMNKVGEDVALSATLDFGILEFISGPMLLLLRWAHDILASWALAIVLLTIFIKLLLFPLTRKSLVQMKRMQELKPDMEEIKEKYEDDKQKQQQEMFALYKRHGVNPLGGCLPMFLQMPIYIALYETLYASVSLYQQPLFGWVDDLTSPDPYYILPLILGATMFVQQKLSPTTMDSQQAKIMMYVMPIMFTGFMLFLPSGLVLYIFTNTLLTLVQQFFLHRKPTV